MKRKVLLLSMFISFLTFAEKPVRSTIKNGGPNGYHHVYISENWFRIKVICLNPGYSECYDVQVVANNGPNDVALLNIAKSRMSEGIDNGNSVLNNRVIVWEYDRTSDKTEYLIDDFQGLVPRLNKYN